MIKKFVSLFFLTSHLLVAQQESSGIFILNRVSQEIEEEKVYGISYLKALYGDGFCYRYILPIISSYSIFSKAYGALQETSWSKRQIEPFIRDFCIDASEFLDPISSFASFNDFFIRRLKPESRPIAESEDIAILPADARYLVYPNIAEADGFLVKGKKFSLDEFLQDPELAKQYEEGTMVIARLCPVDYHRFHFPVSCLANEPFLIQGSLYSVNPIALKKRIEIFSENKRVITTLHTKNFGTVLFVEVGATYVGSIHQTFTPFTNYEKGEEKGYFSFGGSSIVMLFEPGRIEIDQDLIDSSSQKLEVRGLLGQSLGKAAKIERR